MYIGLQVGRGIAALLVLFYHSSLGSEVFYGEKAFNGFWEFGAIGVDFFFVLSGFIIYLVHSNDSKGLSPASTYVKKRLIRIYPPFIVISLVLLIAYSAFPHLSASNREIGIVTSLFLIPTPTLDPALSVSWTLMHEMLFYFIFVSLYFNRLVLHGFLIIWSILIMMLNLMWADDGLVLNFILNPHNLQFLFGIVAAIAVKRNKEKKMHLFMGLFMFFMYITSHHYGVIADVSALMLKTYLGFCFMFIVIGLCSIEENINYPKPLIFLGAASYSIYLIHNPAISVLNRVSQKIYAQVPLIPEVFFIFTASFSLLVGVFYYLAWEKPSLRFLKNNILQNKTLTK
ncbi:MAG: acyltransferase [Gammaproteobacteria bacterium]|nr:acyltransferase [Gammaproteobacteria bacterium]